MNFWELVEATSVRPLNIDQASKELGQKLARMSEQEVFEICCEFDRKMDEAYTWELWGFAYLVNGGCSDDSFMDFRGSLIALGKESFNQAIEDPETLLELGESQLEEMLEEGFIYAPTTVYQELTGNMPDTKIARKTNPSGQEWEETRESLMAIYPKAWSKYGWEEPVQQAQPKKKKPWWQFW